jgi:superfamily II RNA helicase|uniref:Helicase ATP-binding domain-containing protein n=1 Tax=viral metagenome TaxID=1070528 RepID=A0A6C0ECW2_9ZZZZ
MNNFVEIHTNDYTQDLPPKYFDFSYPLDNFQLHGCKAISDNDNLLVTAHTGSGKTALALYAIAKTLSEGKKVIYTSPIKSLSNQKYAEFKEHFTSIGILTGDIKVNPIADLLIMTAEILRNSLLRENNNELNEKKSLDISPTDNIDTNNSALFINNTWTFKAIDIGCVILDEVHFINNPERGKIWEEIIMNLDNKIQLVMLSATITGAEEMAYWIGQLKQKKCHITSTLKRPVPLQHGIWSIDNEITYFLIGDKDWKNGIWTEKANEIKKYYSKNNFSIDIFFKCIKYLYDNNLTPTTVFLLNKLLIEQYAKNIPYSFVSLEESCNIENIWNKHLNKYAKLYESLNEWNNLKNLVLKGIGFHHAGMIPLLKEIVEILYSKGLIKILLATETFAMGVNFPTKTVVFCETCKMKRVLRSEEYGQMAGRAGRRGLDDIGHVIILPGKNFLSENDAKNMILSKPQKISSKLEIDPIYILKYLANNISLSNCNNSLFKYQNISDNVILNNKNNNNEIEQIENEFKLNDDSLGTCYDLLKLINKYDIGIKLAPKTAKIYQAEKKKLLDKLNIKDINIINTYVKLKSNIKEKNMNKIDQQISIIINFLRNLNYIDENNRLTKIAKIISEVNEINPYLLGTVYNHLHKLEFSEIVALLSIFISENKNNDEIYVNDLNCSNICKDIIDDIKKSVETFCKLENDINNILPYPVWMNWKIDLSMFNSVKIWSMEINNLPNSENIINQKMDVDYYGNFIKLILRLNNILMNIESIAKIFNDVIIINKIYGYQEKLIRDIITTESLYI